MFEQIEKIIKASQNIVFISHKNPDADTLGSAIAFNLVLKNEYPEKEGRMLCVDQAKDEYSFLPHIEKFETEFDLRSTDLIVFLDVGSWYMSNFHLFHEDLFTCGVPIVNIDHHSSNENYGDINLVESDSASTTTILYKLFNALEYRITPEIATCLLAGIYEDTGSFKHANTSVEVLKVAADLMSKGGKIAQVSKSLFKTKTIDSLKLWGKAFEKTKLSDHGAVYSVINESDYLETSTSPENLSGLVEYLNMVPDSKYALLLNEDRKGNVKGSMRARAEDVDVAKIAESYGGGGHAKASGFTMPGNLDDQMISRIVYPGLSKKTS